jgi:hypothetical protein
MCRLEGSVYMKLHIKNGTFVCNPCLRALITHPINKKGAN